MISRSDSRKQRASRQERESTEYEVIFIEVSNRVERIIRVAVWIGLSVLMLSQLLLSVAPVRKWAVKVEKLEGIPLERSGGPVSGP